MWLTVERSFRFILWMSIFNFFEISFCLAPKASWTESKPKLEKDPQGRAANPHLDQSDLEKLFREHVKVLYEVRLLLLFFFRLMLSLLSAL